MTFRYAGKNEFVAIAMQLELPDNCASKYAFGLSGIILSKDLLAFFKDSNYWVHRNRMLQHRSIYYYRKLQDSNFRM